MPPVIMLGPHNQTVALNADVSLTCLAAGDPTPSVKWQFNGRPLTPFIQENGRYESSDPGTLRIAGQTISLAKRSTKKTFSFLFLLQTRGGIVRLSFGRQ